MSLEPLERVHHGRDRATDAKRQRRNRRIKPAGFIVDQAQPLAQHLNPDMADGAVLAVVAVAPMGQPFQPVILLGRTSEAPPVGKEWVSTGRSCWFAQY